MLWLLIAFYTIAGVTSPPVVLRANLPDFKTCTEVLRAFEVEAASVNGTALRQANGIERVEFACQPID